MNLTQFALACTFGSALAACGGGGSNGDNTFPLTARTLDGVAAKGLIKNGVVKVYLYGADGKKSTAPFVTGTTDVEGKYSVSLGSSTGLFTVEVSAGPTTTMADEFSGTDISMPSGMTLRSLVQFDSSAGTTVKGYVTPFTEMLVNAAANAPGGLTTANIALAQTGVVTMLGFNPLTTKPLMANSVAGASATDESEKRQSLALASLSKLANDDSNSLGCTGTLTKKLDCVVHATSATLTGGNLVIPMATNDAFRAALEAVISNPSVNKTTLKSHDGLITFSQATIPTGSTVVAAIPATKALFASLRSNLTALSNAQKTGALDIKADALKQDFNKATAPLDKDLADWILISERGMTLHREYLAGALANSVPVLGSDMQPVGNCEVYSDITGAILATSAAEARSVACRLNRTQVPNSEVLDPTGLRKYISRQFTKSILMLPVAGQTQSFTYDSRARMETLHYDKDQNGNRVNFSRDADRTTIGSYGPSERASGSVSYTTSGNTTTGAIITGFMPARTDAQGVALTDQEAWNVIYVRIPEADGAVKYALSGSITAQKAGVVLSSVALQEGSFIRAVPVLGNIGSHSVKEVNLALAVSSANSKVVGTLSLSNFAADKTGGNYLPSTLRFVGSFTNAGSEFFTGAFTTKILNHAAYDSGLPDSTTNFIMNSVSFTGVVRIPSRPDLTLTLSSSNPAFKSEVFSGQYDDGANTILISSNASPKVINISSSNGVSLRFSDDATTADVMKNSSKIATFNRDTGIITYTDGSFESLK